MGPPSRALPEDEALLRMLIEGRPFAENRRVRSPVNVILPSSAPRLKVEVFTSWFGLGSG